jgi:xanthine permease XanP
MNMKRFFGLDEPLPVPTTLALGLQHVLAMFVGIITPPLLIAGAVSQSRDEAAFLVSMALFVSGVATLLQVSRIGPFGSGLLSVQGTSFTFVPVAIQSGKLGGLPLIFGMTIACSFVEMMLSRCLGLIRRLFPPVVTGTVVMLIGMSLIGVGMTDLAGGFGAADFGSFRNLGLGLLVSLTIILVNRFGPGFFSTVAVAIGLVVGYLLAVALGRIDFGPVAAAAWFSAPQPFALGVAFDVSVLIPWLVAYLITTIESMGDLTATCGVSRLPVTGPEYERRLQGGLLADGFNSLLAGVFNSMPNTTFSQNNGLIRLSGVASRRVGYAVGGFLIALGLFPKLAAAISVMPKPVLGGATIIMFALVAMAGLRIVATAGLTPRNEFILALGLAAGLGTTIVPGAWAGFDEAARSWPAYAVFFNSLKGVFSSGMALGGLTALFLNLVLPDEAGEEAPLPPPCEGATAL